MPSLQKFTKEKEVKNMRINEKKQLKNFFELQAIYLRELQNGNLSKNDYIRKIALMSKNTLSMLNIEE